MNLKRRRVISLLVCLFILVIFNSININAEEPIIIKLGHVGLENTLGDDHAMALVFKDTLEKMSGGAFKVDIFPASQLGSARELLESVQVGTLKAAISTPGEVTMFVPEIEVMAIPFIFSDPLVFYKVAEGPWGQALKEKIRETSGLRVIALGENGGFRNIVNSKREVHTPEDMKGLKIRTIPSNAYMEIVKSMGASPSPIPWTELYTACQTGVVDGQQMMVEGVVSGKMYEVQKYITLTGHIIDYTFFVVNDKWFESLPDDYKNYIIRAGMLAERAAGIASRLMDATGLEKLREEGMNIYMPSADEKDMFKQATQKHMLDWLKTKYGAEKVEQFLNAVKAAEKELTIY